MTSRTETYMARVATKLASLPSNATRRAFLTNEIDSWEERFARFQHTQGDSIPNATAFDFADTIAALQIERAKYARVEA